MRQFLYTLACVLVPAALTAQNYGELQVNSVRARFYSHGLVGMDLPSGNPAFEVPIGGGAHPLFSAGLWVGGLDANNSLHLAAMSYEPLGASDWYPGPLTNTGSASTTAAVMAAYDQVWSVNTADVLLQQAYCDCLADPGCDEAIQFPGYQMPLYFNTWPAIGDASAGFDLYQAPFFDYNGDGDYQPTDCDAPCGSGDGSLYFFFNDNGGAHQNSGGAPIGIEVQAMPFAYAGPSAALANTVFVQYRIINQGTLTLHDAYVSLFTDFDLGCSVDDHVGCDVGRSLWYVYNADSLDENGCSGANGYGTEPPAFGATILCGIFQDEDGFDNPVTADCALAAAQEGSVYDDWGSSYGDGIIDNERLGLSSFTYYGGSPGGAGTPLIPNDFYNLMRGYSTSGVPQTYGGDGFSGSIPADHAFPADSDPLAFGTDCIPQQPWSEVSAGNAPGDRRAVGSMGPITLEPGDITRIMVAFTYARSGSGGAMNSVEALQARVDSIRAFAEVNDFCGGFREDVPCFTQGVGVVELETLLALDLFPVPASELVQLRAPAVLTGERLVIRDALGRQVLSQRLVSGTNTFAIGHLAQGIYTAEVITTGSRYVGRVVKE